MMRPARTQAPGPRRRHAVRLLAAVVLSCVLVLPAGMLTPGTRAVDPTPDPGSSPAVTPDPQPTSAPSPEPTPTPDPTPTATPDPTPDPSPTPSPTPTAPPTAEPSPDPSVAPSPDASPSPSATPVAARVDVTNAWVDRVDADGTVRAGGLDAGLTGADRFTVFLVRFRVENPGAAPTSFVPVLEVGLGSTPAGYAAVPAVNPVRGRAFYVASDDGDGYRVRTEVIGRDALRIRDAAGLDGIASHGVNPLPELALGAGASTEIAFAVRGTMEAVWLQAYTFRLRPVEVPDGGATALVTMRAAPPLQLSPGQRNGTDVDEPLPLYPLERPAATSASVEPATRGQLVTVADIGPSPHQAYSLTTDACASCHSSHGAQAPMIRASGGTLASSCFQCHDGSGSDSDVEAEFTDPTLPANDPDTASWYTHPATEDAAHTTDREDEFSGRSERHATCVDCHQPHRADASLPEQTTGGWTAAGSIRGASGVAVTYDLVTDDPVYTWTRTSAFEYELCFKCHSGFTELPARDAAHPSRWALDKAVELGPKSPSYHPVTRAGTNATPEMQASLDGTSPFKRWDFDVDSTVRCLNCHADPEALTAATPPAPEARLSNHTSAYRGILLANYRDRLLKPSTELYSAGDFALCYLCHKEAPMIDGSGNIRTDTGFNTHGKHMRGLLLRGAGGTDIDVDGAGQGNAICAECHFRIHGTAEAFDQEPEQRLINFAPNVQPASNGQLVYTPASASAFGTCTLMCHGKDHIGFIYH